MKRLITILSLVIFLGLTFQASAQSTANYAFSYATNGSLVDISSGATIMLTGNNDDAATSVYDIGFTFVFMGVPYTQFSGNSNGQIRLGSTVAAATYSGYTASTAVLAPMSGDNEINNGMSFKVTGTAPNRVLVVEWNQFYVNYVNISNAGNMQALLYEGIGKIEYIYGEIYNSASTSQTRSIFISSSNTANKSGSVTVAATPTYESSATTPTSNSFAANVLIANLASTAQGSRTVYTFTPPSAPTAPTWLPFTSITQTGMTLNWNDLASNETGYMIYRSDDGGSSYSYITTTAANAVTYAASGLLPGITYYWQIAAINEGQMSTMATASQATNPPGNITSLTTGNWSATGTWSTGVVPTLYDNVTIADGHSVTIDIAANCNNLTVGQGTSGILQYEATTARTLTVANNVTVTAGGTLQTAISGSVTTHILSIAGNLVVNGTLDLNVGTAGTGATFTGAANTSVSGSGATCDFYSITINKGTGSSAILEVVRAITMSSPSSSGTRLTITNGTFKLSSASSLTPYFGSQTICASTGRLWLNNASASVTVVGVGTGTGAGSPTITGELRIDDGTFGYGSGNNTATFSSGSGILRMAGGTFNMYGAISFPSSAGTQFIMSGGNIYVDPQVGSTYLASSTALFSIGSSTTVNWTGGTITIIDPHNASGGVAWSATSGGSKTVTGGTLRLGDGVSSSTGGATANTSGFGFFSSMPVWNVEINSMLAVNSRMVRLSSSSASYIQNSLTINSGGYLFLGSSTTASTLICRGNITNDGTIAGCEPSGTQSIGTLYFNGQSGAQTLSGSGAMTNLATVSVENAGTGVSSSIVFKVRRVNLFRGTLNPTNITIGNPSALTLENPVVQIGGASTTTPAGSFSTLPAYDVTEGEIAILYSTMQGGPTMGSYNEIGTGSLTLAQLLLNDADGLIIPADRTVSIGGTMAGTLTMTLGNINLSGGTLTLGNSAAAPGTLTWTAGYLTNGTFTRWYPTTGLPTAVSTGIGYYPMAYGTDVRQVQLFFSVATALSTGGTISVTHNNVSGFTSITGFTDGGITVDKRTNSNWVFSSGNGIALTGTISLAIRCDNAVFPTTVADLRLIRATDAVGTSANGSGTQANPVINRTSMNLTDLGNTFYAGSTAANMGLLITSVTSGNWGDGSTWNTGTVPTSGDAVSIAAGHTVVTAGGTPPYACYNLTIAATAVLNVSGADIAIGGILTNNGTFNCTGSGATIAGGAATGIINAATTGTFNVSGGTVTLGPAGGSNRTFLNSGTLTVSGTGTLNINGNLNHASGATFNQSGGNINIDGNAAGVAGNSVASGTYLLGLYAPVSWTGGTLTIVDPHANTTATNSIYYNSGTSSDVSSSHTTRFGDGVSSDAGGNVAGYSINTYAGSGKINFGTVIVNGPGSGTASGTNRMLTLTTWTIGIRGDLTINNNGEFNTGIGVILGGNLVVNTGGILTHTGTFSLALGQGTSSVVNPSSQQITNTGTIRNLAASPTANFSSLTINNSNATGVTLNSPISVSGTLTLTSGFVNTTATNLLTLGTATAAGTMSGGSATAFINGPFARTFAVSRTASGTYTQTTLYPVGKGTTYQPMWIDPSTSSGGPVVLSGEAFLTNSGTMGAGVTSLSQARWEGLVISGGVNLTNSYLQISDAGILASNAILQAPSAAGAYGGVPASSIYTAGPPITLKTGSAIPVASYQGYFAYGNLTPCATPTAQPTSFVASYITSTGFTGSYTAASPAADYYLVVRYANPSTPTAPVDYTLYTVGGTLGTGTVVSVSNSTTFTETALTAGTTYDYYIYSYNNSGCSGPVYLTTSPLFSSVTTCSAAVGVPGTPTASLVENDSFRASWTASSTPGVTYLLDVSTNSTFTNFVSGYNGKNVGTALYDDITGLSANTTYYVRVRAYDGVNGCYSTYSGTLTQATECDAIASFPFTEGFEPASTTQACWRVIDNNSDADLWNMNYTTNPRTGTECAMLYTDYNTTNDDWLITPQLTLTGMQRIKFWTRCHSASEPDEVEVLLSTTGRLPSDFTYTLMASTPINFITYAEYTINLNAYSGNVYIAFVRRSAPADGWRLYIDDVTVENIPAVPAIVVDPTSIDFGYTPSGGTSTVSYYVLSGLFLNPPAGNLTVTPPANFEVSLSISSGFSASAINVPYVGGAVTDTVYARFKPTSPNTPYSGNIVNDGGGASAQNVAVSGTSQLVYCAAGASSTSYEKISRIQFGSIDNSSTSTAGYEDFTAISTDAGKGEALSFTGTILGGYSSDQFLVWIDFNQNGSFTDSGEDVYVSPTGVGPHTGEITISATALSGTTRMRVRMHDSSIGPNTTPCGNSSFGQVEDYTVNITAPPACSAPSGLFTTNIENNAATLNWTNMPDSFFDVFFGEPGFDPGSEGTMIPDISTNSCLVENLEPNTDYEWYVIQDCGFETPKVDNFWFSMEGPGNLLEPLSGGTFDEPGEDGIWYLYDQAPGGMDWWNIWFYNDPLDTNKIKKIRMGFWIQSYNGSDPGLLNYVINWSDSTWEGSGFPTPSEEQYIRRSPVNGPVIVNTGGPQWIELYFIIPDFNPEWISVDIWGENIMVEQTPMAPPLSSELFSYYDPILMNGGIIVHECLPETTLSSFSGPISFSTLCDAFDIPVFEDFDEVDLGNIPRCWSRETYTSDWVAASNVGSYSSPYAIVNYYDADYAKDDWFFTGGLNLTAGTSYDVQFYLQAPGYLGVGEKLEVKFGSAASSTSMTGGTIYQNADIQIATYTLQQGSFVAPATGVYYIGWHAYSDADIDYIAIDDINIAASPFIWTGAVSGDWNNTANWNLGTVPSLNSNVIIPVVTLPAVYPNVTGTVNINSITIQSGAIINIQAPGVLNVLNP